MPILCDCAVDVINQFGTPIIGAQVYAVTSASVPGAGNQLVVEKKIPFFLTDVLGRAILPLIRASEFADPNNNTYEINVSFGRKVSTFEFTVPDLTFVIATASI